MNVDSAFYVLAALLLVTLLLGLVRVYAGPTPADRMLAAQLIASTVVGIMLLLGEATDIESKGDVALVIVLLGALSSIAFVRSGPSRREPEEPPS